MARTHQWLGSDLDVTADSEAGIAAVQGMFNKLRSELAATNA